MSLAKYVSFAANSFTLPDICLRLRNMLDDPRSGADDIAKLISVDPSMTAKMLRLANSALFRFPSQIESISKAVNIIGGEALYNLVMAETANSAYSTFNSHLINLEQHWTESVYRGLVARYLANQARVRANERFFVMGILANFSEMVVAKCAPDKYQDYLNDEHPGLPHEKQIKYFGFTFSECSGNIMENWKLPLPLFYPVKNMHLQQKVASELDIALMACANRITLRQLRKDEYENIELFTPEIANTLQVEGETLGNAVEFANKETDKIAVMIR